MEGCRVAPYVNIPSLRAAFSHLQGHQLPASPSDVTALARQHVTARHTAPASLPTSLSTSLPTSLLSPSLMLYPSPLLMNWGLMQKAAAVAASPPTAAADPSCLLRAMDPSAVSLLHKLEANKNTSIADLRLKAKHHASLLGYRQ